MFIYCDINTRDVVRQKYEPLGECFLAYRTHRSCELKSFCTKTKMADVFPF